MPNHPTEPMKMQPDRPDRLDRSLATRMGVTLLSCGIALGLTLVLRDQIGMTIFIFFYAALIVSAWYAGFAASLVVVLFAVVSVGVFLLAPRGSFELSSPGNLVNVGIFVGVALLVSWIAKRMRGAERQALEHARQLEENALELETQMEENQTLTEELESTLQETEEARDAAESANRAKSDFLAVMSHELRTPLNAIIGYTDLLQSEVAGPLSDKQQQHLSRIHTSSWHLLDLIQDVLSFARMEAGRETVRLGDVEATSVVNEVISYIQPAVSDKQLHLKAELPAEPVTLITDSGKLRQVLLNLLTNAVKFTDSGMVGIRLSRDADGVEFQVWDTGRGIDPEYHDMVFEPFTQVDQSTTREKGGAGLGLPVSRRLTELLGGSLSLASARDEGATFSLRLPLHMR